MAAPQPLSDAEVFGAPAGASQTQPTKPLSDEEVFGAPAATAATSKPMSDEEVFGTHVLAPVAGAGEQTVDTIKSGAGGVASAGRTVMAAAPEAAAGTLSGVGDLIDALPEKLEDSARSVSPVLGRAIDAIGDARAKNLDYQFQLAQQHADAGVATPEEQRMLAARAQGPVMAADNPTAGDELRGAGAYIKRGADVIAPAAADQNIATKTIGAVTNFLELGAAGKLAPTVMGAMGADQAAQQADAAGVSQADKSDAVLASFGINSTLGKAQLSTVFGKLPEAAKASILKQVQQMGLSGLENMLLGRAMDTGQNVVTRADINPDQKLLRPVDSEDLVNAAAGAVVHGVHIAGQAAEPVQEQPAQQQSEPAEQPAQPAAAQAEPATAPPEHQDLLQRSLADVEQQIPQAQGAELTELQQRRLALREALGKEDEEQPEAQPDQASLDAKDEAARQSLLGDSDFMSHDQLKAIADTDILTLLPNRRAFMSQVNKQPGGAYTSMDLVGFKNINDTIGHPAGDEMLKAFGQTIRQAGLPIYRTGGDEFTGIHASPEDAEATMQALRERLQGLRFNFQTPDGKPVTVGLNFRYGIGHTPEIADEHQIRTRSAQGPASAPVAGDVSGSGETAPGQQAGLDNTPAAEDARPVAAEPEAPEADEGPVKTKDLTRKGPRPSPLDPTKDDLLAAIAKSGGISSGEAKSVYGFDPADMQMAFGSGIRRVFTKKGLSADHMAELLNEHGYPVTDEHGNYDPHILMDKVDDAMGGRKIYSHQAADQVGDSIEQQHRAQLDAAAADRAAGVTVEGDYGTGHDYPEAEYGADWTPAERTAHDMASKASQIDPDATEAVMEQWGKDAITSDEAVRQFGAIIDRGESHEESQTQEAGAVRPTEGAGRDNLQGAHGAETGPDFALTQPAAPKADDLTRPASQPDIFSDVSETQQALHREQLRRDDLRNRGQESAETGDAGDMFSEKRRDKPLFSLKKDEKKAPTFYSQMQRAIEAKLQGSGTPGSMLEQLEALARNGAFKKEELDWSGMREWLGQHLTKVTKAEVLDHLRANNIQIHEVVHGTGDDAFAAARKAEAAGQYPEADRMRRNLTTTKYEQYQTPGGHDYHELLLTLPRIAKPGEEIPEGRVLARAKYQAGRARENWDELGPNGRQRFIDAAQAELTQAAAREAGAFESNHFSEPNVLAHVRFNSRTDADGKKVLHVEEVQSDWHQKGRKAGYQLPPARKAELEKKRQALESLGNGATEAQKQEWADVMSELQPERQGNKVPDAPFKTTWPMLAMKRMIRYAAENGYDSITWTTGDQQAARYDLSKQIDRIEIVPRTDAVTDEKSRVVYLHMPDGHKLQLGVNNEGIVDNAPRGTPFKGKGLADVIGKELADKVMQTSGKAMFEGADLKVGGEGMKAFYDKMLPNEVNKYVKKWGGKVGESNIDISGGKPTDYADFHAYQKAQTEPEKVHSLDITPAMRDSVVHEGQPLFSLKGRAGSDRAESGTSPDVDIATPLGTLKAHPDYAAAKGGDVEAAYRLVKASLPDSYIEGLKAKLGDRKPTVVPVHAEEATGKNEIPRAFAEVLGARLGLPVDTDIIQSDRAMHTGKGAFHRLAFHATFDGPVEKGGHYLIADDTVTMGGTLSNLRGHIEANGGHVDGILALSGHPNSSKIGLSAETLLKLKAKYGEGLDKYLQHEFGFGTDALTEGEAGHVLKAGSLDTVRDRIAQARREAGVDDTAGDDQGGQSRHSRVAEAVRGALGRSQVQDTISPLLERWGKAAPDVKVVQSEADLPAGLRDDITSQNAQGQVEGLFDPDTKHVYLVADNIDSPKDAVRVLMHEVRGHYRLRQVFGNDIEHILDRTLMTYGRKGLKDILDNYGLDWNKREDRLIAAEEKIAQIAETGEQPGILQAVIAHVREFLRGIFPDLKFSDAEIRKMVAGMNDTLDHESQGEPAPAGARFSRRENEKDDLKGTAVDRAHERVRRSGEGAIDSLGDVLAKHTPEPVQDFFDALHRKMGYVGNELDKSLKPLDAGNEETAAIAKRYANAESEARARTLDAMDRLDREFTPEERQRIWEATSAENVAKVTGVKPTAGFDSLTPKEREAALELQKANDPIADEAVKEGALKHRYQIYDPRFLAGIAKDNGGGNVLNPMGHDMRLTTPHAQSREHLTADESEAAAKALYGDEAHLIRDAKILPFAAHQLQRIINARKLLREIEEYGQDHDTKLVVSDKELAQDPQYRGYKTIDNPAFTYVGKQEGLFGSPKLHIHPDLEGPLKAVLASDDDGIIVKSLMALKSKAMGTIIGAFPPIHRSTVFFKTAVTYPMAMFTGRLQAMGKSLRTSDGEAKYQAIRDGLRDVSRRGWVGSVDDLDSKPRLDDQVGKSWTAQMLGLGGRLAGMPAGKGKEWQQAVKQAVDDAGHFWHSTIMWDKVANTQYGLYATVKSDLIKRGMSDGDAGKVAAQVANRFVGAIAREDMSKSARTVLNLFLFSRSFTMSNLGLYKDALGSGLPKAVAGQLDAADKSLANNFYRRKAAAALTKDIAALVILNAGIQSAVAYFTKQQTGDQILAGYKRRLGKYVDAGMHNPLHFLTGIQDLSPTSENEPEKEDYIYLGRNAQGTGMYLKNPFGKVGFDLQNWMTHPIQELGRKESTLAGPVIHVLSNDKGYGRQIYSQQDPGLDEVMDVAKYLVAENTPSQLIKGGYDFATGKDRSVMNAAQSGLGTLGLFVSHGAPGGPPEGFLYAAEKEHDFKKQQVMPDVRQAILSGNDQDAIKAMQQARMTGQEMKSAFESTLAPEKSGLSKERIFKAMQFMSPDERAAFVQSLQQSSKPD